MYPQSVTRSCRNRVTRVAMHRTLSAIIVRPGNRLRTLSESFAAYVPYELLTFVTRQSAIRSMLNIIATSNITSSSRRSAGNGRDLMDQCENFNDPDNASTSSARTRLTTARSAIAFESGRKRFLHGGREITIPGRVFWK